MRYKKAQIQKIIKSDLKIQFAPQDISANRGVLNVIRQCISQVREMFPNAVIEVRLDSAFFQEKIIKYLLKERVEFAIKVPMWQWLGVKDVIQNRQRWTSVNDRLAYFFRRLKLDQWGMELSLHIYRHKLSDRVRKGHHQLDL